MFDVANAPQRIFLKVDIQALRRIFDKPAVLTKPPSAAASSVSVVTLRLFVLK